MLRAISFMQWRDTSEGLDLNCPRLSNEGVIRCLECKPTYQTAKLSVATLCLLFLLLLLLLPYLKSFGPCETDSVLFIIIISIILFFDSFFWKEVQPTILKVKRFISLLSHVLCGLLRMTYEWCTSFSLLSVKLPPILPSRYKQAL